MERAAVRDWAAQRAMVVLGALLKMASAAAEYVNAATEVGAHRVHQQRESDPHPTEMIHYGMTKTAQLAISRGLAESCAGTAVTVNAVLAGPTRSAWLEDLAEQLSGGRLLLSLKRSFSGPFVRFHSLRGSR
jgi:NAD(P)-dependent dehydrogenase (short-subunit alcohol dehydrogenase family)